VRIILGGDGCDSLRGLGGMGGGGADEGDCGEGAGVSDRDEGACDRTEGVWDLMDGVCERMVAGVVGRDVDELRDVARMRVELNRERGDGETGL
jgi:hypothetical protein